MIESTAAHFGLRLVGRAMGHALVYNYAGVN